MQLLKKALIVIGASTLLFGGAARAAVITQLGFLIDGSGSISGGNFGIMRTGYATAFAGLPTDGSVELTVIQFGTLSPHTAPELQLVVDNVVITGGTLPAVLANVNAMAQIGGNTPTGAAITMMTTELTTSSNYSSGIATIVNIGTDGQPTIGSPNPDQAAINAAAAALAAGVDALTAEAIGGAVDLNFLRSIVFSPLGGLGTGQILALNSVPPNPMTSLGWVLPVNTFDDFATAIQNKVQVVTNASEPGSIALLGLALGLLGFRRGRRIAA